MDRDYRREKFNNRIHSNKQGRAAVTVAKFEENVAFTNASFPACR